MTVLWGYCTHRKTLTSLAAHIRIEGKCHHFILCHDIPDEDPAGARLHYHLHMAKLATVRDRYSLNAPAILFTLLNLASQSAVITILTDSVGAAQPITSHQRTYRGQSAASICKCPDLGDCLERCFVLLCL